MLHGASLAIWAGELVCVGGGDLAALALLHDALHAADRAARLVSTRHARPGAVLLLPPTSLVDRVAPLADAAARLPSVGAVLLPLRVSDDLAAWRDLIAETRRIGRRVPVRLVRLVDGRIVPPPGSVDPFPGRS